jgi:hypothetical protein
MAVTVWQISDAVDTVVCAPDDAWKYHSKHVEQFSDVNKLCNVACCWIYEYIGILLEVHHILHFSRIRVNLEYSRHTNQYQISLKNITYSRGQVIPCGRLDRQTDKRKLTVAFAILRTSLSILHSVHRVYFGFCVDLRAKSNFFTLSY